jgi:hypothetical protein
MGALGSCNLAGYPDYNEPGAGGAHDNDSTCAININDFDNVYGGFYLPGGGGYDDDGDGIPNINDLDWHGMDKPGGGADTCYCGNGIPNVNCPQYPGFALPGGGGYDGGGLNGGDYDNNGNPHPNAGDGTNNIDDSDFWACDMPGGGCRESIILSNVVFGDIEYGAMSAVKYIYLTNNGSRPVNVIVSLEDFTQRYPTALGDSLNPFTLSVSEKGILSYQMTIGAGRDSIPIRTNPMINVGSYTVKIYARTTRGKTDTASAAVNIVPFDISQCAPSSSSLCYAQPVNDQRYNGGRVEPIPQFLHGVYPPDFGRTCNDTAPDGKIVDGCYLLKSQKNKVR